MQQAQAQPISTPQTLKTLRALLTKNLLIISDNLPKYLVIYSSPFLVLLFITMLQSWANSNFLWQNPNPDIYQIPPIPHCYGEGCVTLAYAVNGDDHPYVRHTIDYVKKVNSLPDQQVVRWNMTIPQIIKKLKAAPNITQAVVVFCTTGHWQVGNIEIPCYAEDYHLNAYTIIFNLTLFHRVPFFSDLKAPYPKDMTTVRLKKDIDQGIILHYNPKSHINITASSFPSKNSRFVTGFSIFAQYGSFFIMIPYLILMVMQGSQKLKQKQDRLRIGLNIVGVTNFQFYFIQSLTYLLNVVILSVNFCIAGYIFNIKFWTNSVLWFDFLLLVLNGFTLGLVAFSITAAVKNKNLGMSVIYAFVLYSIVMQWLFSGGYILELLYMDTASTIVKLLKALFNLYPSYHFTKIFADISRTADSHYDTLENRYVEGRAFVYSDLFWRRSQSFEKPFPRSYTLPNCIQSVLYMGLVAVLYIVVLMLLDRFVESNRGYSEKICPSLLRRRRNSQYYRNFSNQQQLQPRVKITNLQKTYNNQVHALQGVSAELIQGEIVSLLGENGAGKSTLINILIGVLEPSRGQVTIEGMDVQTNRNSIRNIIGVCPQFDILWEEMTAEQHVRMFCLIKGYPCTDQSIKKCLDSVWLYENRSGKVKTFSGGMRRRLSLAISLIGDPKLVILDEPTTGMDAKIRLQTWRIILQLKDGQRTILLTTHNMQQSECLSDRILIMSKGKIVAEGTTAQLKNKYGQGYIITGKKYETGEEVSFKFKEDELEEGMKVIEEQKLENWALQQTTLEQVFINISNRY